MKTPLPNPTRICKKCLSEKSTTAYVGKRGICRVCWPYLTPLEQAENLVVFKSQVNAIKKLIASESSARVDYQSYL